MKWIELKKIINKFTDEQLNQNVIFSNEENSTSGVLNPPIKCKADLMNTFEDDPCPLYTRKQLREMDFEKDEIEGCGVEIAKGNYYFKIPY